MAADWATIRAADQYLSTKLHFAILGRWHILRWNGRCRNCRHLSPTAVREFPKYTMRWDHPLRVRNFDVSAEMGRSNGPAAS